MFSHIIVLYKFGLRDEKLGPLKEGVEASFEWKPTCLINDFL